MRSRVILLKYMMASFNFLPKVTSTSKNIEILPCQNAGIQN